MVHLLSNGVSDVPWTDGTWIESVFIGRQISTIKILRKLHLLMRIVNQFGYKIITEPPTFPQFPSKKACSPCSNNSQWKRGALAGSPQGFGNKSLFQPPSLPPAHPPTVTLLISCPLSALTTERTKEWVPFVGSGIKQIPPSKPFLRRLKSRTNHFNLGFQICH